VAEIIGELGLETESPTADLEHQSWEFRASGDGMVLDVNVFHMDDELHVHVDNMRGCLPIGGRRGRHRALQDALFERLARDERFSGIACGNRPEPGGDSAPPRASGESRMTRVRLP
jgi:hypothetical protein